MKKTTIIMVLLFGAGLIVGQELGNYLQASIEVEAEDKAVLDAHNVTRYYISPLKCDDIQCQTVWIKEENGLINSAITPQRITATINQTTGEETNTQIPLDTIQERVNAYAVKRVNDLVEHLKPKTQGDIVQIQNALNVSINAKK